MPLPFKSAYTVPVTSNSCGTASCLIKKLMFLTGIGTGSPCSSDERSGEAVMMPSPLASDMPKKISPGLSLEHQRIVAIRRVEPIRRDPPHLLVVLQILSESVSEILQHCGRFMRIEIANFVRLRRIDVEVVVAVGARQELRGRALASAKSVAGSTRYTWTTMFSANGSRLLVSPRFWLDRCRCR